MQFVPLFVPVRILFSYIPSIVTHSVYSSYNSVKITPFKNLYSNISRYRILRARLRGFKRIVLLKICIGERNGNKRKKSVGRGMIIHALISL